MSEAPDPLIEESIPWFEAPGRKALIPSPMGDVMAVMSVYADKTTNYKPKVVAEAYEALHTVLMEDEIHVFAIVEEENG